MPCLTPTCSHTFSCPEISEVSMEELFWETGVWSEEVKRNRAPKPKAHYWEAENSPDAVQRDYDMGHDWGHLDWL